MTARVQLRHQASRSTAAPRPPAEDEDGDWEADRPGFRASARAASAPLPRDYERRFRRVLHPHIHRLLRPVFRPTHPFTAASCLPPSNGFRWIRPEPALSKKCSLFPSNRGVIWHPLNGQMTEIHPLEQSPFSCTAPAQGGDPPIRQVAGRAPLQGRWPGSPDGCGTSVRVRTTRALTTTQMLCILW